MRWGAPVLTIALLIALVWASGCADVSFGSQKIGDFGSTKEEKVAVDYFIGKYGDPRTNSGPPRFLEPLVTTGLVNTTPIDKVTKFSKDTGKIFFWGFYDNFQKGDPLTLTWTFNKKTVTSLQREAGGDFGRAFGEFLKPDKGWATGTHTITISGGGTSTTATFEIIDGQTQTVPLPYNQRPQDFPVEKVALPTNKPILSDNPPGSQGISISAKPATGVAPLKITFEVLGISDSDRNTRDYQWNFGDGTTGHGAVTEHTYTVPGTYSVSVSTPGSSDKPVFYSVTVVVKQPLISPVRETAINVIAPLEGERFIHGETLNFRAELIRRMPPPGSNPLDASGLQWVSDRDGKIGTGADGIAAPLSVGTHRITVSGYETQKTVTIRVFNDLMELYQSEPSPAEIQRIESDFRFIWVDDPSGERSKQWSTYDPVRFDQHSTDPNKMVVFATLDVMRHQKFSTPLPTASALSLLDALKQHTHSFRFRLDDDTNVAGYGEISLNKNLCTWPSSVTHVKSPVDFVYYTDLIQLIIHEDRHNYPNQIPGHTNCKEWCHGTPRVSNDPYFEDGSGFAFAAMYQMWVYKYGMYDPPDVKLHAKNRATWLLTGSAFCTKPTDSDPDVQALINELLAYTPTEMTEIWKPCEKQA